MKSDAIVKQMARDLVIKSKIYGRTGYPIIQGSVASVLKSKT